MALMMMAVSYLYACQPPKPSSVIPILVGCRTTAVLLRRTYNTAAASAFSLSLSLHIQRNSLTEKYYDWKNYLLKKTGLKCVCLCMVVS
jgi:hypothetical protein